LRTLARFWNKRNKQLRVAVVLYGDRKTRYPILKANFDPRLDRSELRGIVDLLQRIRSPAFLRNNDSHLNRDGPEALDQALAQAVAFDWSLPKGQRYLFVHYDNSCYADRIGSCRDRLRALNGRVEQLFMKYTQTPISVNRESAIALAEESGTTFIDSGQSWTLQIFNSADNADNRDATQQQM
jgi:hypothetical protein